MLIKSYQLTKEQELKVKKEIEKLDDKYKGIENIICYSELPDEYLDFFEYELTEIDNI